MKEPLNIGIIGGMSPESTVTYYLRIIRRHQAEFRDHSYPRIVITSVSFQKYIDWQHDGDWDQIARALESEFQKTATAGADFALLATNTMHKVLSSIQSSIPILSILDAVGRYAKVNGVKSLGLTGTKFTMSNGFYVEGLESHGLTVVTPSLAEQEAIHRIIYDELIFGKVNPSSVSEFSEIGQGLLGRGADMILLGCTELELLTREYPDQSRFLDSTRIHADAAWEIATGIASLGDY
jgi:aspartate racemase